MFAFVHLCICELQHFYLLRGVPVLTFQVIAALHVVQNHLNDKRDEVLDRVGGGGCYTAESVLVDSKLSHPERHK